MLHRSTFLRLSLPASILMLLSLQRDKPTFAWRTASQSGADPANPPSLNKAMQFTDIETHWAKAAILALAERKLVNGYPDGSFKPDGGLTRAEFASLTNRVFPYLPLVRPAVSFPDSQTHWANPSIIWAYERGLFSGYPDGSFKPDQAIPRMQAVLVLATVLGLKPVPQTEELLKSFFDDAAQIPNWARWAIATATLSDRVIVNYPDVRLFQASQNATRGELAAMLCRVLEIANSVPVQYATWGLGIYQLTDAVTVPFERWKGSGRLMRDIQVLLTPFRLFPPGNWVTGRYDWQTEQAMTRFCDFYGLPNLKTGQLDAQFAWSVINADPVEFILAQSTDRQKIYSQFLEQEAGYNAAKLAFLDRGYQTSAYAPDVSLFPSRMLQKPDGVQTASHGQQAVQTGSNATVTFKPYPSLGAVPEIASLDFLHPNIVEACVCIGSFVNGDIWTRWLGKNATQPAQMWSTTKIIPLIDVAAQANGVDPAVTVRDGLVCPSGALDGYGFYNLAIDLVSYRSAIASSNSVAAMFKQFFTPAELESWLKQITGNNVLEFQGRYGEAPLLQTPCLVNQPNRKILLDSPSPNHFGNNLISAYDLTRVMSLLGWHGHLPLNVRIPNADWKSLETIVRAMGTDTARYIDVAIETLGLGMAIESPVIISKMGFGRSETRGRTELSYVAYFQFIDKRPRAKGKPGILRTVCMALLGAEASGNEDEEARQLDARMAAEVTEIVRQIATQELI